MAKNKNKNNKKQRASASGGANAAKKQQDGKTASAAAAAAAAAGSTTTMTTSTSTTTSPPPSPQPRNAFVRWFYDFPMSAASFTVLLPYSLYMLYYTIRLKHPEWVAPVLQLRPALLPNQPRPLLIVATMGSGTVQAATDLSKLLNIEVAHEASDASWYFCRDGTVSWFHGIRFFEEQPIPPSSLLGLCTNITTANMGFHPRMYRHSSCSPYESWNDCWKKACYKELIGEWGCGLTDYDDDDDDQHGNEFACPTPFTTTLHQVRNPLRVIESLVVKFCMGGLEGQVHPAFLQTLTNLFPAQDFSKDTCIEAAARYVIEYNAVLIAAREEGYIDDYYRIEDTSPCQVARMAGFMEDTTLYSHSQVVERCRDNPELPATMTTVLQKQPFRKTENPRNTGLVQLSFADLRGGMHGSQRSEFDTELEEAVRELFDELGYNIKDEEEAAAKREEGASKAKTKEEL